MVRNSCHLTEDNNVGPIDTVTIVITQRTKCRHGNDCHQTEENT